MTGSNFQISILEAALSGKIINLKQVRKQKAREEKSQVANANAMKFGRTKAQRLLETAREDLAARRLDQLKFDDE